MHVKNITLCLMKLLNVEKVAHNMLTGLSNKNTVNPFTIPFASCENSINLFF